MESRRLAKDAIKIYRFYCFAANNRSLSVVHPCFLRGNAGWPSTHSENRSSIGHNSCPFSHPNAIAHLMLVRDGHPVTHQSSLIFCYSTFTAFDHVTVNVRLNESLLVMISLTLPVVLALIVIV